jgi:hypothetical protein
MVALHLRYRTVGHHDEVMEAVWHALADVGRVGEGNRLLSDYLARYRRFRSPLGLGLSTLVSRALREDALVAGDDSEGGVTTRPRSAEA